LGKILVTGCAGFIGSHLTEKLLNEGHSVIGIDNFDDFYARETKEYNLSHFLNHDRFQFVEFDIRKDNFQDLSEYGIDSVIHLAAKAGVLPSVESPGEFLDVNIKGTQRILDFMRDHEIKKLVFASSSSIYGNTKTTPFKESMDVNEPISPYASTKKSCELLIHSYHHLFDMDVINLRFFTVFGPRQRPDLAIHKFVNKIKKQETIQIYGDGETSRDYTYIGDIIEGVFAALKKVVSTKNLYEIINLGNGSPVSLINMVNTIFEVFGEETDLEFVGKKPGDVEITYADISKAKSILNYDPKTSFRQGIEKFKEWHLSENG
jgi:nucleoside-diphosphate-sugar epimerase